MKSVLLLLSGLVVLLLVGAVPASAASQTGPVATVTPASIVTGGTVTITLTAGTTTGTDYSCASSEFLYYNITEISVNTPSGDSWQLGSATQSGFLHSNEGGNAQQIKVLSGDTFVIPYGPTAYPITISGNAYYWWLNEVAGIGTKAPGDRLDSGFPHQAGDPYPTTESGTYVLDISGNTYCNEGSQAQPFKVALWFDLPFNVTCCNQYPPPSAPEFPAGLGVVLAASMLGLVLLRKRFL
jgi:hypothetical protein